jgi:hypothetical protein
LLEDSEQPKPPGETDKSTMEYVMEIYLQALESDGTDSTDSVGIKGLEALTVGDSAARILVIEGIGIIALAARRYAF